MGDESTARQHRPNLSRVVFAGGGTGGHVYMAVSIREELQQQGQPACLFVGTLQGIEMKILPPLDFPLETIRIGLLRMHAGESVLQSVTMELKAAKSLSEDMVNLLEGHREVERLLAERRATGTFRILGDQ